MSGHSAGGLGGPANSAEPSGLPRGGVTRVRAKAPFQDVPGNSSPCPPLGCTWVPKPRVPGPDPLEQTWDLQASAGVGTSALLECTWDRHAPSKARPCTLLSTLCRGFYSCLAPEFWSLSGFSCLAVSATQPPVFQLSVPFQSFRGPQEGQGCMCSLH